jgi:hypothetical protein
LLQTETIAEQHMDELRQEKDEANAQEAVLLRQLGVVSTH